MALGIPLSLAFMWLAQSSQTALSAAPPWGEFYELFRGRVIDGFTIATLDDGPGHRRRYIAKRGSGAVPASAHSDDCPALLEVVDSLPELTLPRLQAPTPGLIVANDGKYYSMRVRSDSYAVSTVSHHDQIADWTKRALRALEPCWSVE
jgi:hypothetical protein